jgi:AcrR family transcriptional regulator
VARRYHHGEVRPEAITAALVLTEEGGPEAVTMRAVAARVGIDHRAIYRHFDDREGLLAEVAARGFADLLEAMQAAGSKPDLKRDFEVAIRFALARPELYALMLSQPRERLFDEGAPEKSVRALLGHFMIAGQALLGPDAAEETVRNLVFAALGASYGLISLAASMTLAPRSPDALEAFLIEQVTGVIEGQVLRLT